MTGPLFAAAALVLAMVTGSASASAADATGCKLGQFIVPGLSATYDPFDVALNPAPVTVTARASGDCKGARIQLALVPTPTDPQTGSQVRLIMGHSTVLATIEDASGQPKPVVSSGSAFVTNPMSLPIGTAGQIIGGPALQLDVVPGQASLPGTYSTILSLVARVTDRNGHAEEFSTPLVINLMIKPSVRLAAGSGALDIDLGELKAGGMGGPVNFDAYANVDYDLRVRSSNGFVMKTNVGGSAPGVPYVVSLSSVALSSIGGRGNEDVRAASFDAPAGGLRRHSLRVTVQPFPALAAGIYTDVVIVEIRARI